MSNCLFEATLQQIEVDCQCVPRYFADQAPGVEICVGKSKSCMVRLKRLMGDERFIMDNGIKKVKLISRLNGTFCLRNHTTSHN